MRSRPPKPAPPARLNGSRKRHGGDTFKRDFHRFDEALIIEFHAINASHTMVAIGFAQRTAVVNDVILLRAGNMNHRMMPRAGGDLGILLQDFSDALERAGWSVGDCVSHGIVWSRPAAFRPHEII